MALHIENPEADRLARDLALATGTTLTEAVTAALRAELVRVRRRHAASALGAEVRAIQDFVASLPDRDPRPADEVLGYTASGLFE